MFDTVSGPVVLRCGFSFKITTHKRFKRMLILNLITCNTHKVKNNAYLEFN